MRSTCRYCKGTGKYIKFPCSECDANGVSIQRKKVRIPVPAGKRFRNYIQNCSICAVILFISVTYLSVSFLGVDNGHVLRITVPNREVFATVRIEKNNYFKREGINVYTEATISVSQAALGGTVRVQGVYEDQTIQVLFMLNKLTNL